MTKMNERVKFIGFKRHCIATDGEGVTTLAAFWGCPLRCKYCLNPQSLREETKCTEYTPEELYERVKIDDLYFVATRGGVTFGGGEPLLQTDFIESFRSLCGDRWRIYAETSLNVPTEAVEKAADLADGFIVDIKDMNPDIYKSYTGRDNTRVIENLELLLNFAGAENTVIRLPLIRGYNTEADRRSSRRLLEKMGFTRFDEFTYKLPENK